MAVDRGGLSYRISIEDRFSKTTGRFRRELEASRKSFRDFQRDLKGQRGSARALKDTAEAVRTLAAATRQRATASRTSSKALTDEERQEKKFAATKQRILDQRAIEPRLIAESLKQVKAETKVLSGQERTLRTLRKSKARLLRQRQVEAELIRTGIRQAKQEKRQLTAVEEANRRVARAIRERAVAQAQVQQFRSQGQEGLITPGLLKRAGEFEKTTNRTRKSANSLLFTFRRIVGTLAVFTLAREAVQSFRDLVGAGVQFNDQIQISEIAIAGLVSAVGDVRDEFGKSVEASEELALSQKLARTQIQLLRQDALRTTATFEQLLDTFQVAVAPGFAAGLDIDEIRQLTVSISQAATAIGLPQNQLAEEIRSLLAGTIQARTTRIATALGITNDDIRRLKESGELFDFLEDKFEAFGLAAEQAARQTLGGIRTLIEGGVRELLGQAAQPLFDELLVSGNELFDQVLTVRDELGNLRPNPQAVAAFQGLFQALAQGVRSAREFAAGFGFEGLRNVLDTVGTGLATGLEFAFGFAQVLFAIVNAIVNVVRAIADAFGITNVRLGQVAGLAGVALAVFILWRKTGGFILSALAGILNTVGKLPPVLFRVVGIVLAILEAFKLIFREVTGLENFGFLDTAKALQLAFEEAFATIAASASLFGKTTANALLRILTDPVGEVANQLGSLFELASGAAALIPGVSEDTRLAIEDAAQALRGFSSDRGTENQFYSEASLNEDRQRLQDIQTESQAAFDQLFNNVANRDDGQGAGLFGGINTALQTFVDTLEGKFTPVVSTAGQDIAKLAGEATKLVDQLRAAEILFDAAGGPQSGGTGGRIQGVFTAEDVANAERLREIRQSLTQAEAVIAASVMQQMQGTELNIQQQAELQSAMADQLSLQDTINEFEAESLRLSVARAATIAREALPALQQEARLLELQAQSETALGIAASSRLGARQLQVLQATQAVQQAQLEAKIRSEQLEDEIEIVEARRNQATDVEQRAALTSLLTALQERLGLEEAIARAKGLQLESDQAQANLIQNGGFFGGLKEGFVQLSNELPTLFEAAVNIVKGIVQQLSAALTDLIVSAFDENDETTLRERVGRFLQSIAQIALQQLIQTVIQAGLQAIFQKTTEAALELANAQTVAVVKITAAQTAAAIDIAAAQTVAAIRAASAGGGFSRGGAVGLARGGPVGSLLHQSTRAVGLAAGGPPPGIAASDTVPAWLTPGEFVVRRAAVDNLGLGFMQALNRGSLPIASAAKGVGAQAPKSGGGAVGMQTGGFVADRQPETNVDSGGGTVVLPILAANERTAGRILGGGRNAQLRFSRENAQATRTIQGGNRK
jgi:hypothetical protein